MSRYLACARIQFSVRIAYRAGYLLVFGLLLLQVYLMRVVWTGVYGERDEVGGIELHTMIAYATLAVVQFTALNPWPSSLIPERVREGKVAVDLLRPISFPAQMLSGQFGTIAATLPFVLAALPFALLIGAAEAPASAIAGLAYVVALSAALVINQLLGLLLGMVAFWTLETTGINMIYRFVLQFFSGALVPLWFMPGGLRTVGELLPFQAVGYTPVAIYLGYLKTSEFAEAIALQLFWIAALAGLASLVWSRAQRRLILQGG